MIGVIREDVVKLRDVICPEELLLCKGNLFLFDKINADEGRLYKYDGNSNSLNLVKEFDEGECFFGGDAYLYMLTTGDRSIIEKYGVDGEKMDEMEFASKVYSIYVDLEGIIYAIYSEDDGTSVRIYSPAGEYIRAVHSRNMSALSAVYCDGNYVYAGGVSTDGMVKIEKINFLGFIESSYEICTRDNNRFVSRILQFGNFLIALVSDDYVDEIYAVDQESKSIKKLEIDGCKAQPIYGIDMIDSKLCILTGDKRIVSCEMVESGEVPTENARPDMRKVTRKSGFRYIVNLISIKNFSSDFINFFLKYSAPASLIFLLYSQFKFQGKGLNAGAPWIVRTFVIISFLVTFACILVKNITMTWRKRPMVDNMLDIYNRIETVGRAALFNSIFTGFSLCILIFFLLSKNGIPDTVILVSTVLSFLLPPAVIYPSYLNGIRKFKRDIKNMVFELLNFNGWNDEMASKIDGDIKKLRKQGVEEYRIKILTGNNTGSDAVKVIDRWSELRKKITGDRGKLKKDGNCLVFDLNLKNRDIKYSRVSVIKDFICYINKVVNIKSVVIETADDNNASKYM